MMFCSNLHARGGGGGEGECQKNEKLLWGDLEGSTILKCRTMFTFCQNSDIYIWEQGTPPPPPFKEKLPNNPVFADFFPELTDQDPKSNYLKVIKLIRYHLPPIVKHVLAPQNDCGMPKITWSNHKSFGIQENPPPPYGKNSQKIPYFFF